MQFVLSIILHTEMPTYILLAFGYAGESLTRPLKGDAGVSGLDGSPGLPGLDGLPGQRGNSGMLEITHNHFRLLNHFGTWTFLPKHCLAVLKHSCKFNKIG